MSTSQTDTLQKRLDDLHQERVRTWDAAALALNVNQRKILVETADWDGFIKAGDVVAPFTLPDVDGGVFDLAEALKTGPVVLIFFRFAGCPACNIALPYYEARLAPELARLGVRLVAISPQVPERLVEIKTRHGLSFTVASDLNNRLAGQFGIVYTADAANQAAARAKGAFIGDVTGTGTWDLPQPTAVVIGPDFKVAFADVAPDWLLRTEAEPILEAAKALTLINA